jgi:hypothetical protein
MGTGTVVKRLVDALEATTTPLVVGEVNQYNANVYRLIEAIREAVAFQIKCNGELDYAPVAEQQNWSPSSILMECFDWYAEFGEDVAEAIDPIYANLMDMEMEANRKAERAETVVPQGSFPPPILSTENRIRNEKEIIQKLWELAHGHGCHRAEVWDGEQQYEAPTFEAAWSTISAVDGSTIEFFIGGQQYKVEFILGNGNNGFNVVSDYTCGDKMSTWYTKIMAEFNEWVDEREERFNSTGQLS